MRHIRIDFLLGSNLRIISHFLTKLGHLRLELAYDSRTVKKQCECIVLGSSIEKALEQVIPASLQRNKKVPLENGTL